MEQVQVSNVIAALDRDHANMAALLDILESEVLAIEVGKTPDFPLLRNIMLYMTQYPDRFHHPKEDVVFAQLADRDPGARSDVDRVALEHSTIGLAGRNFRKLLRSSAVDSVSVREGLKNAGLDYIRALRKHMLLEEKKLFPLAIAVLTKEDWLAIDDKVAAMKDPSFGEDIATNYRRLYRLIADRHSSASCP